MQGKPLKSGLHRARDNEVKVAILLPHHHCFPSQGGNLPEFKDLSRLQFMVGFLDCLQEEASNLVRNNMIEYDRHLFQDAIETNWATARHARLVLLQDTERGKCVIRPGSFSQKPMYKKVVSSLKIKFTRTLIVTVANHRPHSGWSYYETCLLLLS